MRSRGRSGSATRSCGPGRSRRRHMVPARFTTPRLWWAAAAAVAACSSGNPATAPTLPPCTVRAGTIVTLAVGAYVAVDPATDSGCATFAANRSVTDTLEYLLVPQGASGNPGDSSRFALIGADLAVAALTP